jgi:DNA adenine methylase
MADKRRRSRAGAKAAYNVRQDQRSDPKPKSPIRRNLARLIPPKDAVRRKAGVAQPKGALYAYDEQKAMDFADAPEIARIEAQPFLKWAGGKTGLLSKLDELFPSEVERYVEPFLGGGAVFFHLKRRFPRMRAFLRDSNEELINCYRVVRDHTQELMRRLDEHAANFDRRGSDYYYEIRRENQLKDEVERAARTIFLNKTCFNGLYRVNAKGEFNTPVGSAKNPSLYNRDSLLAAAWALRDAELEAKDFRESIEDARRGDVVYLDPPYFPISEYSDFKRYTSGQFRETDHVDLARGFRALDQRGCLAVLSNSDHPRTRELYADYPIRVVQVPRMINCKGDRRGSVAELVITNAGARAGVRPALAISPEPRFPDTKYMGSKQRLLPFIIKHISGLRFSSALDAFSGSGCVAYALKRSGARVYANDFLTFCFHIARATVENDNALLSGEDRQMLLSVNPNAPTFIRDTYENLFFDHADCEFLDNLWVNVQQLKSPLKKSLALAAASRACMKKRPRGLFTFTGHKGWDGRLDLKLSMRDQFLLAVDAFNNSVFSNGQPNKAFNCDVFDLERNLADLVYIDTPYISPFSDSDYTRRYHFVEGFCKYWKGVEIMQNTTTKKLRSYETAFSSKTGVTEAFQRLFDHFKRSILVVSYSSNGIPNRNEMVKLLKEVKRDVTVHEIAHRYSHGNQNHKVGDNKNEVIEYLFVAQ